MNANELADELETIEREDWYEWMKDAATMLRKLQTENEALKDEGKVCARCGAIAYDPVITQTANTLTNEEIEEFAYAFQLWQLHNPDKALEGIMDFARAILKKASEK